MAAPAARAGLGDQPVPSALHAPATSIDASRRPPQSAARPAAQASVATWLGVLLLLLLTLNTVGGWVRLSGSGVAIPRWPVIHDGSLLPPADHAGWQALLGDWQRHQQLLEARVEAGEIGAASRGRSPTDLADFQRMFWTEYSHRLLAAVTALVLAGCLTVTLRDPDLRRRIGRPLGAAAALVVVQAGIGAALIDQGTNTHWLFLHQGNAALVVAAVVWALMRLLPADQAANGADAGRAPRALRLALAVAAAAAWVQLLVGALVAGSRFAPASPGAPLWDAARPLAWNLLDNAALHQFAHRVWASVLVVALVVAFIAALRAPGLRLRLALQAAATFVAVQVLLGLATVLVGRSGSGLGTDVALPLAHQLMGMCVFTSLILAAASAAGASAAGASAAGRAADSASGSAGDVTGASGSAAIAGAAGGA